MASRTILQTSPEHQPEAPASRKIEPNVCRPSQSLKPSKSDSATAIKLVAVDQTESKCAVNDGKEDKKLTHHQKGSFDTTKNKVHTKTIISSETSDTLPSDSQKQPMQQGLSTEVNKTTVVVDVNGDQGKNSEQSGNDIIVSTIVSDGTSSLTADFVDSGKSSMCRPSTNSDISDESSCSSLSSSITKPHKTNDSKWEAIKMIRSRDGVLGLSHFRLLKKLGCGDIGSVYLSELSGTKSFFAMKLMDKGSLASRKKLLRAQTEREILQSLDHPFLPTLYTHFETDKFSCLVMEFCPGGDLHTLRQRQPGKHFSEQAVKKSKPEIGNQVRPLPELIAEPTDARSMSFVGTHEYLAPEIVKGEGHGSAVDWWTFGIFMYELLFGKTPFKGSGNRATLFNVVGQPLRFPESPTVSFAARDLIRGLLVKEPQHRFAYKRGASEIKQHPFFEGVNWALIRCASPPEIPKSIDIERLAKPTVSTDHRNQVNLDLVGNKCYYLPITPKENEKKKALLNQKDQ
ncbi:hypothetical protein C4D60_Mb05t13520 [Musa balbisiana]|uniref:non-specific serine/threonine protein kinase n=1 Tax=Musa balbisiana TaxID=52838 RepID=A0A4S8JVV6_MUSBA|nr:hypothetical protein C4D60_Mb05t13520 [Musa balbisiana]